MNKTQLDEIINLHKLWINDDPKGRRANLSGVNLPYTNLSGANLEGANLSGANLEGANLKGANLGSANLSGANLYRASLSGAYLEDANLYRASLSGAYLEDANLKFANLKEACLFGATFNKETVFPSGFDPIARGMILVGEEVKVQPSPPSPNNQEEVVAAVPAAVLPKTLQEELSEVLAKHGLELVSFRAKPCKVRANKV